MKTSSVINLRGHKPFDDEHIDTVFYTNDLKELYDQICETEILNVIDILE